MTPYVILTDSSADLPAEEIAKLNIEVLPLSFLLEGKTYENHPDERDIRFADFYAKLRQGASVQTSAVNVGAFLSVMQAHLEQGQDVLYLGFSSALSGTYSAGAMAAEELRARYPDRKILTVDTLAASLGQGLLVTLTARRRDAGATIEEAAAYAEETKLHICHWFTVGDLFFLKRGGRISAATALIGSALGIKPILHMDDAGRLISVGKTRGRKRAIAALAEKYTETGTSDEVAYIVHGDCPEDAQTLEALLRDAGVKNVMTHYVGPVIGAHSGPDTLSVFFIGTHR